MLDINTLVEIKGDNKNILEEEDISDIDMPVEIEEDNKEKDMEI
jgi:hypothetical protein